MESNLPQLYYWFAVKLVSNYPILAFAKRNVCLDLLKVIAMPADWVIHTFERRKGCPASEQTARRCLSILKPTLHDVAGESWEELDATQIAAVAQSLRWLVWPKVDKDSLESLAEECPRIIVNPKPSPFGYRGFQVPKEAFPNAVLDNPVVEDIDPKTWAISDFTVRSIIPSASGTDELPVAEKFRLAFLERDNRLAPKRAKNARQHQRRAERAWVMMSSRAKAMALASQASKPLHH